MRTTFLLAFGLILGTAWACSSNERDVEPDAGKKDATVEDGKTAEDSSSKEPLDAGADVGDPDACPTICSGQQAQGNGDSTCPIGYKYDGKACVLLRGCSGCTGADCKQLMKYDECQKLAVQCAANCPVP